MTMETHAITAKVKSIKAAGELRARRAELERLVDEASGSEECERVGHILRNVTIDDLRMGEEDILRGVRVALLSNFNCDGLEHLLRPAMLKHRLWPNVHVAGFNQYI